MANVVDPNAWRMIPPSEPNHPLQATPSNTPEPRVGDAAARHDGSTAAIGELSTALGQTFDATRDKFVWNFTSGTAPASPGDERFVRVDGQHASLTEPANAEGTWLVIVESARDVLAGHHFDRLHAAAAQAAPMLLVACDVDDPLGSVEESAEETAVRAVAIAARLRCQYVGPIAAGSTQELAETLARIKRQGQPTLLHVNARGGVAPPHFDPAPRTFREPAPARTGSLHEIAAQALAELARADERIVVLATEVDAALANAWQPLAERLLAVDGGVSDALAWCANLAADGARPFVFLSAGEAQDSLGQIHREISASRAAVTLILETRASDVCAGSSCLAGIRQLPHVALLAPKDAAELAQMFAWCAAQEEPAVVWLPWGFEADFGWPMAADIALGRCEQLSGGQDVAIVAWGPMTAAATIAAENLALMGVEASVINTRFAQPLDRETIARAAQTATYVVLVDDAEQPGGFAGWVLEHLLREGVAQPTAIVTPPANFAADDPHEYHQQCARAIVDRCRWLAEPLVPNVTIEAVPPATASKPSASLTADWETFIGQHAQRTSRERAQVYARQVSSDTARWVAAYEEVGSRDVYLWQWCTHGVELTTLPCVVPELRAHVCDTKMLSIVLCVLLDDVADQHGNSYLLDALLEMTCWGTPQSELSLNVVERRHAQITRALWAEYLERIAGYPSYEKFEPVLRYDLLQFFNTMRYSHLVNGRPYLLNMAEHDLYTSHNMMMVSFATLDLMCGPDFPEAEVGTLREAIWHAQCMGRIGNLLSTWRRELANRDFTSGVFARAMMEGDLTLDELEHGDLARLEAVIRNRGHEAYFFRQWLDHREQCHARAKRVRSLDLRAVLDAHDRFFAMHLGSQGLI